MRLPVENPECDSRPQLFEFNPASIEPILHSRRKCGFQGVFSEYGTYPLWSPYKGTRWRTTSPSARETISPRTTYFGPWHFMALEEGDAVTWNAWQDSPYRQDAGSSLDPNG